MALCPKCGKTLPDGAKFCTGCGFKMNESAMPNKFMNVMNNTTHNSSGINMTMVVAIVGIVIAICLIVLVARGCNKSADDKSIKATTQETTQETTMIETTIPPTTADNRTMQEKIADDVMNVGRDRLQDYGIISGEKSQQIGDAYDSLKDAFKSVQGLFQ